MDFDLPRKNRSKILTSLISDLKDNQVISIVSAGIAESLMFRISRTDAKRLKLQRGDIVRITIEKATLRFDD